MRCDEFDLHAMQWLEGKPAASGEAEAHLQSCRRCSTKMADLEQIVSAAAALPTLDPPERVWTSIRAQLGAEGLLRTQKTWGERLQEFFPAKPRTALATATISALAALLLMVPPSPPPGTSGKGNRYNSSSAGSFAQVSDQLASAEAETNRDVQLRDPEVVASYRQNLAMVDSLIGECQKKMDEDPGDEMAREYLVTAYQQKADLLGALSERYALGD